MYLKTMWNAGLPYCPLPMKPLSQWSVWMGPQELFSVQPEQWNCDSEWTKQIEEVKKHINLHKTVMYVVYEWVCIKIKEELEGKTSTPWYCYLWVRRGVNRIREENKGHLTVHHFFLFHDIKILSQYDKMIAFGDFKVCVLLISIFFCINFSERDGIWRQEAMKDFLNCHLNLLRQFSESH